MTSLYHQVLARSMPTPLYRPQLLISRHFLWREIWLFRKLLRSIMPPLSQVFTIYFFYLFSYFGFLGLCAFIRQFYIFLLTWSLLQDKDLTYSYFEFCLLLRIFLIQLSFKTLHSVLHPQYLCIFKSNSSKVDHKYFVH